MKIFYLAIFCSSLLYVSCSPSANSDENIDFSDFSEDFVDEMWRLNPISATYNGFHAYDDELPIPNAARRADLAAAYQKQLDQLKKIDFEALSNSDKVDYKLIENQLESNLWYREAFKSYEWNPSNYNLGGAFFYVFKDEAKSLDERLAVIDTKLTAVPEYYEAAKANIKNPTKEHTDLAIAQVASSLDVLKNSVLDSVAISSISPALKASIETKVSHAEAAVNDYVAFLKEMRASKADNDFRSFRIGSALYSKKFDLDINSGLSAEQLFAKALEAKGVAHTKMQELALRLWPKYFPGTEKPEGLEAVAQLIKKISESHTSKTGFVEEVRRQIPELEAFVKEKDLIYLDPNKPLVVRETPKYMRGVAGASVSAPGPYDKDAETYYNVTPIDDWSDEQAESYLREYNDYMLQILNIHEAIPGHYTQLVYSNESPSLIKSLLGNGAMIEGWACFSERMMLENGYGDGPTKDEMMLMYYKWNLRIICNAILDYGIHNLDWDREKVMDLLVNEAFQEDAEAEGKWKRATLSQVQLTSYFTGLTEIYDFKEEEKARLGDAFSIKAFNEEFLSFGSAPVRLIKELMADG
ncbi:MAG: DUF885 domain-containing protein [Saprospiraceae bacterium]|nr:DUF885 domain-containing protein [Saprospiraceae bacterium]